MPTPTPDPCPEERDTASALNLTEDQGEDSQGQGVSSDLMQALEAGVQEAQALQDVGEAAMDVSEEECAREETQDADAADLDTGAAAESQESQPCESEDTAKAAAMDENGNAAAAAAAVGAAAATAAVGERNAAKEGEGEASSSSASMPSAQPTVAFPELQDKQNTLITASVDGHGMNQDQEEKVELQVPNVPQESLSHENRASAGDQERQEGKQVPCKLDAAHHEGEDGEESEHAGNNVPNLPQESLSHENRASAGDQERQEGKQVPCKLDAAHHEGEDGEESEHADNDPDPEVDAELWNPSEGGPWFNLRKMAQEGYKEIGGEIRR